MKRSVIKLLAIMLIVCFGAAYAIACGPNEGRYTVTYVAGGGTGEAPEAEKHSEGDSFELKDGDVFSRDGYTFKGWNDGTRTIEPGSKYTMPGNDVVFTAQWQENATLEGKWTGAQLDGEELVGADVKLDVEITIKNADENGIYSVLAISGTISEQSESDDSHNDSAQGSEDTPHSADANGDMSESEIAGNGQTSSNDAGDSIDDRNSQTITMCAAMYMAKDEDGNYSAENCTISFEAGKLTVSMSFSSADVYKVEFTQWARLGTAPSVNGTYTAEGEDGDIYTVTFGENATFSIKSAPNSPDLGDESEGSDSDMDSDVGEDGDMSGGMDGQDRGDGAQDELGPETDESGSRENDDANIRYGNMGQKNNYDDRIMPIIDDNGADQDGPKGDMDVEENDESSDPSDEGSVKEYEVDKIVSVGEYLVIFVNDKTTDMTASQSMDSTPILVLFAGENGELIANTGEGERLVFSKAQAQ